MQCILIYILVSIIMIIFITVGRRSHNNRYKDMCSSSWYNIRTTIYPSCMHTVSPGWTAFHLQSATWQESAAGSVIAERTCTYSASYDTMWHTDHVFYMKMCSTGTCIANLHVAYSVWKSMQQNKVHVLLYSYKHI